jgi:hypothetical protein
MRPLRAPCSTPSPKARKIKEVADTFFEIAKQYVGAVPKGGDRNVVVTAIAMLREGVQTAQPIDESTTRLRLVKKDCLVHKP